ncbi:Aste57867_21050 [Aphanomyces stellatus]|uniref:Aste57867_21050 protein n=1 Tax=Aphanomyces stellatus TaxID=120398 RepID=A0A485LH90_9STRA|nr:hypothetical protein As57867_020982 [Aphanomyces stellatus]VFT97725.1 Aste57867_21050 [Aphanomyces stellatus]
MDAATSPQESLEEHILLQRVFRIFTIDIPEKRLARKLQVVESKLAELYQVSFSDGVDAKGHELNQRERKRLEELKEAYGKEKLKLRYAQDDMLTSRRVTKEALVDVFEKLGMPRPASDVDDLIWEVNDSLDGTVSWDEFKRSFVRCKHDKTCLEPTDLFHVTCFLMYDRECSGKVSTDDAMHMLFLKYGNHMEDEMEALFGKELKEDEFVMSLTFKQYVDALERRRIETIDKLGLVGKMTGKRSMGARPMTGSLAKVTAPLSS